MPESWYIAVHEFPDDNYYNIADVASENLSVSVINIELPESLSLKTGFYYLWPGAISIER